MTAVLMAFAIAAANVEVDFAIVDVIRIIDGIAIEIEIDVIVGAVAQ